MSAEGMLVTRVLFGRRTAEMVWGEQVHWLQEIFDARALLKRKARTFALAARFLPAAVRDDVALLYAFCRTVDDLADEGGDAEVATAALERLRLELGGQAVPRPLLAAFRNLQWRTGLSVESAQLLIDGVLGDLTRARVADDAELLRYGYSVASTVGLMMCGLLGVQPWALPHAVDLGVAMQITNIVRDVGEDAARGRVYLPADRLAAEGIVPEELLAGLAPRAAVARVVADLVAVAEGYYRSAEAGMAGIPARFRPAIRVASRVYGAIGRGICATNHDPCTSRFVVGRAERLTLTLSALAHTTAPQAHDASLHWAFAGWPGTSRYVPSASIVPAATNVFDAACETPSSIS